LRYIYTPSKLFYIIYSQKQPITVTSLWLVVLLYRYILTVIQRITQNISTLLIIAWLCAIVGCRDFKDYRTPYKSFVTGVLKPINEDDKLTVTDITNTNTNTAEQIVLQKNFFKLPLDPNTNSVQFDIHDSSATSPKKLTIYYHRKQY
jgi:hypothetical protein